MVLISKKVSKIRSIAKLSALSVFVSSSFLFAAGYSVAQSSAPAAPAAAVAQEAPEALIKRVSTTALERIQKDPELAAGDVKKINVMIDQVIMPHVNFQRMTSLAVGRSWRTATPDQQKQLLTEFRALLVRSYANAFAAGKDRTIRVKPVRMEAADTEVTVNSELVPKRGEALAAGYRLEKAADGWKAYDVNILGVWLVDNYRNQFSQEIAAKGIDGLIKSLSDKNKGQ